MRRWMLLLLVICLPLSRSFAEDTTVIAAFGDSLFAGFGVDTKDSFTDQLEHRLKADGHNVNIINFGVSGDTTAGGVARIDHVIRVQPTVVFVELGANDLLRGMRPEETRKNLDTILSHIHAAKLPMLVMGQKAPLSYGKSFAKEYNPIFCELAKKYGAACYPVFLKAVWGHPDLMQSDGMHPNARGVKAIVDDIYPMVVKLMKK